LQDEWWYTILNPWFIRAVSWKEVRTLNRENEKSKKGWETSGLFIPAGLFIGLGIGWALGYLVQGLLIGMGGGFLAMAIARLIFELK
jgi:hypothetical protein